MWESICFPVIVILLCSFFLSGCGPGFYFGDVETRGSVIEEISYDKECYIHEQDYLLGSVVECDNFKLRVRVDNVEETGTDGFVWFPELVIPIPVSSKADKWLTHNGKDDLFIISIFIETNNMDLTLDASMIELIIEDNANNRSELYKPSRFSPKGSFYLSRNNKYWKIKYAECAPPFLESFSRNLYDEPKNLLSGPESCMDVVFPVSARSPIFPFEIVIFGIKEAGYFYPPMKMKFIASEQIHD